MWNKLFESKPKTNKTTKKSKLSSVFKSFSRSKKCDSALESLPTGNQYMEIIKIDMPKSNL